jgi:hypothetical protein
MQQNITLKLTDFIDNFSLSVIYYKPKNVVIERHIYIVMTHTTEYKFE